MNIFYILFLLGIFSLYHSLPLVGTDHPVNFDFDNITVATTTAWFSSINIANLTDDSSNELICFVNVSQDIFLPGNKVVNFELEKKIFKNVYSDKTYDYIEKKDGYTLPEQVSVSTISSITQDIDANINFTDIANTTSRISYDIIFRAGINVSFPAYDEKLTEEINNIEYPKLDISEIPQWILNADFGIPLANATGSDQSVCILTKCNSTEGNSHNVKTWYINEDIIVTETRDIENSIRRFIDPPDFDGFMQYAFIQSIRVNYELVFEGK